jgi:hypothetical protein
MNNLWDFVTTEDVVKAIDRFNNIIEKYPLPKNTFLIFNDKKYPAKHIRGLAYLIAYKKEISKDDYNGGAETVLFFKKLGFVTEYKRVIITPVDKVEMVGSKGPKHPELILIDDVQTHENSLQKSSVKLHTIARLVVTGKQYDNWKNPNFWELEKVISKFLERVYKEIRFEFIVTPGGFLTFYFPVELNNSVNVKEIEENHISLLKAEATKVIDGFFAKLSGATFLKLQETADFFTIGIDGSNNIGTHVELVAIYDLRKCEVIHWTGKFYPTEGQNARLVKINDLTSHFVDLNKKRVLILGCHDLNVFNPRGQASANPAGWKKTKADQFINLCKEFDPEIILQHPHTTDSSNIWNSAWRQVEKDFPNIQHYASGIKYYRRGGERERLHKVLEKTKKGDVVDFYFD